MCYVFLGTIQELVIQHLDGAILRGPETAKSAADEQDETDDGEAGGRFDDKID